MRIYNKTQAVEFRKKFKNSTEQNGKGRYTQNTLVQPDIYSRYEIAGYMYSFRGGMMVTSSMQRPLSPTLCKKGAAFQRERVSCGDWLPAGNPKRCRFTSKMYSLKPKSFYLQNVFSQNDVVLKKKFFGQNDVVLAPCNPAGN